MLPLLTAITAVGGFIKDVFVRKYEVSKARHEVELAVEQRKKELALKEGEFDELVVSGALARTDGLLRRVSYSLLTAPFIVAIYDPSLVAYYFNTAIAAVPDWYAMMYFGMIGAIWGLPELVNRIRSSFIASKYNRK